MADGLTQQNTETNKSMPHLKRRLRARQLSMIAIGGCIGTGLFLASGLAIHQAGPGGTLLAYGLMGLMVYFLMTSLGEIAAYLPTAGSFYTYAEQFVDPALGYALGVNYWYNWAITLAAEIAAAAIVMKFWFPAVPPFEWSLLFLGALFSLNACSVRGFGEAEYVMSWIKVSVVIVFIILGSFIALGGFGHSAVGLKNWHVGDAPFHGGILATFGVFLIAGFSFQGTELVGVAAGESEAPETNIPKAIKLVFWRLLLFYVMSLFVISLLIPYTSPQLINQAVIVSPFTLVFSQVGLHYAAGIMNFVILIAVLSAGNSGMYASTRMLWHLAKKGHTPKIFARINKRGVPMPALLATLAIGMMAFLTSLYGEGRVYEWLLSASGLSGFITWLGIAISHYRFRRAYVAQGRDLSELPYRAKLFPFGPWFAGILCLVVVLGQNYEAFTGGKINWHGLLVSYIGVPLFVALWLGYKIRHKTKVIPLTECDFDAAHDESLS